MNLHFPNGFLVQHLHEVPHGMENIIDICGYHGLFARCVNPLSLFSDLESQELSKESQWRTVSDREYVLLEFISDPNVLLRYIKACLKHDIPIRLLFVESDYSEELWTGPEIPKKILGYEYNTIPIDNQIVTDLSWYRPLSSFLKGLNPMGLFASIEDVMFFKLAYDQAYDRGEIGDGDMQTHIFCLYEVQAEDILWHLSNNTHSDQD